MLYFTDIADYFNRERERGGGYFPRYNNTAVKNDSNKTQSGWLPVRHKAHLSWSPIVTKNNNTKPIYCKVQGTGFKGRKCAQISNASSYCR